MNKADASKSRATPTRRGGFPDDFKQDAVRLVVDEEYSFKAAAKAVGVSQNSLRAWHRKFAPAPKACGNDATLDDLIARRPTNDTELLRVKGIGPVKIEKHGVAILEILNGD